MIHFQFSSLLFIGRNYALITGETSSEKQSGLALVQTCICSQVQERKLSASELRMQLQNLTVILRRLENSVTQHQLWEELTVSPSCLTHAVHIFIHFQGLNAGVEMFTVVCTVTQMYTIALTITKLMLLRKSEKKIQQLLEKRSRRFELLLEYKIL